MAKFNEGDIIRHINSREGVSARVMEVGNDSYLISTEHGLRHLDFGNDEYWEKCGEYGEPVECIVRNPKKRDFRELYDEIGKSGWFNKYYVSGDVLPFAFYDSSVKGWTYTVPDGYVAEIKDGKVIIKEEMLELTEFEQELAAVIGEWSDDGERKISRYVRKCSPKLLETARKEFVEKWIQDMKNEYERGKRDGLTAGYNKAMKEYNEYDNHNLRTIKECEEQLNNLADTYLGKEYYGG